MIKDLFFASSLQPDFAKSSGDGPHFFLHCLWMKIATFAANKNSWEKYCPRWWPLVNLGSGPGFLSSNPMITYRILRDKNWGPRYLSSVCKFCKVLTLSLHLNLKFDEYSLVMTLPPPLWYVIKFILCFTRFWVNLINLAQSESAQPLDKQRTNCYGHSEFISSPLG